MRIVFMGTPLFSVNILQGLIDNYEVVGVVSQPDKEVGRSRKIVFSPIKELALKYEIPVFQPNRIREEYQEILDLKPDMIVTCAYGQIIPKEVLDYPKYGCINVHASLLPKLRGGAPIHKAIIDGYKTTGITIMYMDVGMDSGDIISQRECEILDSDNLDSLSNKLSIMGGELLLETLPSIIDGTNKRIKQNEEEVTFAYNIKRGEEHIDFNKTSKEIFNLIRGLSPAPSAYGIINGEEMKIIDATILDKKYNNGSCGEVVEINKKGMIVKTLDGSILITKIKPFGKKMMDTSSYLNGSVKDKIVGWVFE